MARPLRYKDTQELQAKIDAYFSYCDDYVKLDAEGNEVPDPKPYTVSGLSLWLDIDTDTLRNYEGREDFSALIKRAKQRIEQQLETELLRRPQVTGHIFNLKNNYGWKDRHDVTTDDKPITFALLNDVAEKYATDTSADADSPKP